MPQQISLILMMGFFHCVSVATFMASSVMMWCMACKEMLPGMHGCMILVEGRGGEGTCAAGWSVGTVSSSMMVYRGGVGIEHGGFRLRQPGRMSWMVTAEVFLGGPLVGFGISGGLDSRKTPGRSVGGHGVGV